MEWTGKDCAEEDFRKKYHLEWRAFVEDFGETMCPEDKAYLRMEEKKWKWMEKKKAETDPKTAEMEEKKDEKDPKTEEVEEKKSWKARNAKKPIVDID